MPCLSCLLDGRKEKIQRIKNLEKTDAETDEEDEEHEACYNDMLEEDKKDIDEEYRNELLQEI